MTKTSEFLKNSEVWFFRKRAATKGDHVVEVKPGEEVVSVNVGWTVEKFVAEEKKESGKKKEKVKALAKKVKPVKKSAPKKASKTAKKKKR